LQITDNPKGYNELYDVGKEIVCYKNMNDAIKKINYYLKNDKERESIAKAGYKKAIKEYTYEKIIMKHVDEMLEL
jgi:spore maturation protein CgeB